MSITACTALYNVCSLSSAIFDLGRQPALTSRWKEWQCSRTRLWHDSYPSSWRVTAVNFLQPLLVSRRSLLTSVSTCWRPLTTVRPSTYWIGSTITNQCIRRWLLSPAAFSAYQHRYSGNGSFHLAGILSRNRHHCSSLSKSSLDRVLEKAYQYLEKKFPKH